MDAPGKGQGERKEQPSDIFGVDDIGTFLLPSIVSGGKVVWKHINKEGPLLVQIMESKELPGDRYVIELKITNIGLHSIYIEEATLESSPFIEMGPFGTAEPEGRITFNASENSQNTTEPERIKPTESKEFVLELKLKDGPSLKKVRSMKKKYKTATVGIFYHDLGADARKEASIKVALRLNNRSEGPVK